LEAEDSYDDSFDETAGESGNGSEEDGVGEVGAERDPERLLAAQSSQFQAPPASMQPLYDVTSSQFVVHVQQQPSSSGIGEKHQGPNRPIKIKKTTVPSFIGLKLRLKVRKDCVGFATALASPTNYLQFDGTFSVEDIAPNSPAALAAIKASVSILLSA
jgi:hypothetical protein